MLKHLDIIIGFLIFSFILIFKIDFYKVILYILELIVLIEVIQMIIIFFKNERIRIRYMIDASIIYFTRELLITVTKHGKYELILEYVLLIGIFFFFRFLSLKVTYK